MSPDPAHPDREAASRALHRVARFALLSVVLGFTVQGAVLAITLWGGGALGSAVAQAAGGVTWAVLVCAGVGVGTVLSKGRPLMAGLLAAVVAPLSIAAAKAGQKVMSGWLGAAQSEAVLSLGAVSLLRAVEYGLLGWLLGRLVSAGRDRPEPYLGAGAAVGVAFGGLVTVLTARAAEVSGAPLTDLRLAATVVNEVLFPAGCALVIFVGQEVGRSLRIIEGPPEGPQVAA